MPAGATINNGVVKLHDGDSLTIMVTPAAGKTVSYWQVAYGNTTAQYRATSLRYTIPDIKSNFTLTPIFSSSTYNTVSWSTISESQNGIILSPLSGYVADVAAGKDFKFKLSGSGMLLLDKVYANNDLLVEDNNGVYTIPDIRENKIIRITIKEIGIKVNGVDIGAFSGTGWNYDPNTNVLTLNSGGLVLSGQNSTSLAKNFRIVLTENAPSVTLSNLTIRRPNNATTRSSIMQFNNWNEVTITVTGKNSINNENTTMEENLIAVAARTLTTLRGNGSLSLENRSNNANSGALFVEGNFKMVGNPQIKVEATNSNRAVYVKGDIEIGAAAATHHPCYISITMVSPVYVLIWI